MSLAAQVWASNRGTVSVNRGPLTFSLLIQEKYVRHGGTDTWPAWDLFPASAWNYGLVLPAAREFSQYGIRVNAIAPGIFLTPMLLGLSQQAQDSLAASLPFPKKLGDPSQFAALAHHMIDNRYLNGTVVRLDAALRMSPR